MNVLHTFKCKRVTMSQQASTITTDIFTCTGHITIFAFRLFISFVYELAYRYGSMPLIDKRAICYAVYSFWCLKLSIGKYNLEKLWL